MRLKKCSKGKSCAKTCISRNKRCSVKLTPGLSVGLRDLKNALKEEIPYSDWKVLAQGNNGKVSISPDGKRVVKTLLEGEDGKWGEFGPYEVELATKMGKLGHSPIIRSSSDTHIEMDVAKGSPLWKTYTRGEDEPIMNAAQATRAGYALRDLHKMGFAHGDAHSQQFLVDGNNVKLVDFGLSVPVSKQPSRVMQDLSKIAKLVGWDNPELSLDPYFQIVNKHLNAYTALGSSTSKAAKAKRIEIAEAYLKDLSTLEQ
jgi:tRNA A-37 threonylcarbamoyl transferase component Bud32